MVSAQRTAWQHRRTVSSASKDRAMAEVMRVRSRIGFLPSGGLDQSGDGLGCLIDFVIGCGLTVPDGAGDAVPEMVIEETDRDVL